MMNKFDDKTVVVANNSFEIFGPHLFLKKLASGGMAEVFLARPASHLANGRLQVVKRILPHIANNDMFLDMFQTEIQIILGFNHPHTIQLHDFGECADQPYISMEYIEGKNLKELIDKYIQRKEHMPVAFVLSLMMQAAAGLSYAHTFVNQVTGEVFNAIHRDISPHNLIISYGGNVKVIDFGIAKAINSSLDLTQAGTLKGKLAYLAPEQLSGKTIDARTDIFALAVVAWELLTLKRPFSKPTDNDIQILENIHACDQKIVPPSKHNSEIPREVDELFLKALRKNPDERYATAQDFQTAIRQVMLNLYPNYSYSDNAKTLVSIFSDEILVESQEIRDLNQSAQVQLMSEPIHTKDNTVTTTKIITFPAVPIDSEAAAQSKTLNIRLQNIEKIMKQKASTRQYFILAIYIIGIAILKFDENDVVFNYLFSKNAAASSTVLRETKSSRKKTNLLSNIESKLKQEHAQVQQPVELSEKSKTEKTTELETQ